MNNILATDPDPNKGNNNNFTINMYGKKLELIKSFKYLGVILTDNVNSK